MIGAVIIGAIVGAIAGKLMHANLSMIMCIIIGIGGSFMGNFLFGLIGFSARGLAGIIVYVIGACIVIALARKIK